MLGMVAILGGLTIALGPLAMFNLYFMPYWINVMWLDAVTYLHHHGPEDEAKIPWYRGEVQHVVSSLSLPTLCQSASVPDRLIPSVLSHKRGIVRLWHCWMDGNHCMSFTNLSQLLPVRDGYEICLWGSWISTPAR